MEAEALRVMELGTMELDTNKRERKHTDDISHKY
jgi:hypothetical protein